MTSIRRKTILIIEDDKEVRETITELVEIAGYLPVPMPDGQQAIQFLKHEIPDLIISDIMMPNVDGYQVLEYVNNLSMIPTAPFIFISARADHSDWREGMTRGADDYITKPFRAKELLQSIETQLKKKEKLDIKFEHICENISTHIPHELTTPIVSIVGYPDLIIENFKSLTENEIIFMLTQIKLSGLRLNKTIGKFIKYADIQSRLVLKNNKVSKTVNHSQVLTAINLICLKLLPDSGRDQDLCFDVTDAELNIEQEDLEFIIEELLTNAMKFSNKGTKIIIHGKKIKNMYSLEITDHGRGLTTEQICEIVPFVQHERKVYEQQGSGLGLITITKIAEYYDGILKISSFVGSYSTFEVLLPLATK
jgi:two-component system sensor histidine kinase/response regulator